jgi:Pyridine nucleotide-disulphide oxidoreductase, dimerisation domain
MQLICTGKMELVVGLHFVGMGAEEMLQGFGIAIIFGATKDDFHITITIHSTASEDFVTMAPWGLSAPYYFESDRYSVDHWIGSHPNLVPCDLSRDKTYL